MRLHCFSYTIYWCFISNFHLAFPSLIFFSSGLVSTSGQLAIPSEETEKGHSTVSRTPPLTGHATSASPNAVAGTTMQVGAAAQQPRPAPVVSSITNASTDWTAQLKNDLGIGGGASTKTNAAQTGLMSKSPLQNAKTGQVVRTAPRHTTQSSTVEFVSGEANGPTLPEYQFGFHVDSATGSDEHDDDVYGTSSKSRPMSNHTSKVFP